MKNDKSLDVQFAELENQSKKDLERKMKELTIKDKLKKLTGLNFMVLIHSGKNESTSIWVENSKYGKTFERNEIKKYSDSICTLFTPTNKPLTFATSKEIENFAPVKISIENSISELCYYHDQTVSLQFTFDGNINLTFKDVVFNMFNEDIVHTNYIDLKPGRKNPMTKKAYSLQYNICGKVNMYGDNFYHYCKSAEELPQFMNIVFTGNI